MKRLLVLAPLMALLAGQALAQQTAATGNAATARLNDVDRQFVAAAASGGVAEVDTARLAEQQAGKAEVKSFAQRMITDHTKANQQLASLASQEGLTAPTEPDAKQKATATKLKTLSGTAFDRAYVKDEIQDHKETIALFQKEAKSSQDPQLKQFASQTLPTPRCFSIRSERVATPGPARRIASAWTASMASCVALAAASRLGCTALSSTTAMTAATPGKARRAATADRTSAID